MNVQIFLDKTQGCYTNLDVVSGKVVLHVPHSTNVSNVIVKLEGESRTRLVGVIPPLPGQPPIHAGRERAQKEKPLVELHKLLYRTLVVWPPPQMQQHDMGHKASFTLAAGNYEWPFQFKLPFNNSCWSDPPTKNVSIGGLQMELVRIPERHVKQTLPPSMNGFPGEAEIRYYVKVTVNRPEFYKENPRAFNNFTFLPIEPPRVQLDGENYARRQHQFQPDPEGPDGKKGGLVGKLLGSSPTEKTPPELPGSKTPPRFSVDARLPNPAVLTCNDSVPLKILVRQLNERKSNIYLQMLHIELVGYTKVRAHELARTENNVWVVASMSNMAIPLGSPEDPAGTEIPINPEYWQSNKLPPTVAPSFDTCNISRYYELEVRVGLGYGSYQHGKDQLIVLPLRLPVKVYSGIAPPQTLLDRIAMEAKMGNPMQQQQPFIPGGAPPPPHGGLPAQSAPGYNDAPPSYEDAIASDMPPIEGPRRDYATPHLQGEPSGFPGDRKSS